MIKEIVKFTELLDDDIKKSGIKPKYGLHILFNLVLEKDIWKIGQKEIGNELYSKKDGVISDFLSGCIPLQQNAWMIDTNKCFDTPTKAIHSCSPYCVGFKREHLQGGVKYEANAAKKKPQLEERMSSYFSKAMDLVENENTRQKLQVFEEVFVNPEHQLYYIDYLKTLPQYEELAESDYIIFYLNDSIENYKKAHENYLGERLFNTAAYNTKADEDGVVFGTSNFKNGFDSKKPYLIHKTATFDISNRISNKQAFSLFEFEQILPRKVLPNPLPIFIYSNELQKDVIGLYNREGNRLGYKEIIEQLWDKHNQDFANYYLLNYQNTKDGLVFNDFDFVTKFEYDLTDNEGKPWFINSLFGDGISNELGNVFQFQNQIIQKIFNNNLIIKTKDGNWRYKYFDDIDEQYCKSSRNYLNVLKYRKAIYEFVFKSKRQAITSSMFSDMIRVSILEDIRLDKYENNRHSEKYNIYEKLNIWFSLNEKFNQSQTTINQKSMASKLKDYLQFVNGLADGKEPPENASDTEFVFAAGQVIAYVLNQSESADKSYQHLEPFLQKVKAEQLKGAIAHEIARYKHKIKNYKDSRFKPVAAFVLSYEADVNLKKYLPEMLAGLFSDNLLYNKTKENDSTEN